MKKHTILFLSALMILLFLTGCNDDESVLGDLAITPANSSYEGIRGNEVVVAVTALAEDGILSLKAVMPDESENNFSIPENTTTIDVSTTFTIPADAILNTTYPIRFTLNDLDGNFEELEVEVVAGKLISNTPATYDFQRDGTTTVSYSGQNERLDMVEEMKAYLHQGDNGNIVLSSTVLNDAYTNTNDNGNGFFSFTSTKQLKNKTFQPDLDIQFMENLFIAAETASTSGETASNGTAGFVTRENSGNTILVDANGREFTQLIEKGLMGTVMYNQIYNTYLTDDRTGNNVENTLLREGKNYTDMEHHWDEAFGYWNPPLDFTSDWPTERENEDRFWSHYSNVVDPYLGTNDLIMQTFLEGRAAIVNNDLITKDQKRAELYEHLELVAAATAVHYINDALEFLNAGKQGEFLHVLSEAWAFVNALQYNANRKITLTEITQIKETDFGANGNFWNVTAVGLNTAKTTLVAAYPALSSVQDQL